MQLRTGSAVLATALFALAAAAPAAMAAREPLNAYRVAPTAENKQQAGARRLRHGRGRPRRLPRDLRHGQAGRRPEATRGSRPSSSARPARPPSQAADVPVGSDAHVQRLAPLRPRRRTTARSSTSSSMTGSRA